MLKPALYISPVPGEKRFLAVREGRALDLCIERIGFEPFRQSFNIAKFEQWCPAATGAYVSLKSGGKAFMPSVAGAPKPGVPLPVTVVRGGYGSQLPVVMPNPAVPGPRAVAVAGLKGIVLSPKIRNQGAPVVELLLHHLRRAEVSGIVLRESALTAPPEAVVHECLALSAWSEGLIAGGENEAAALNAESWLVADALNAGRVLCANGADADRLQNLFKIIAPDLAGRINGNEGFAVDLQVDQALEIALGREFSFGSNGTITFDEGAALTAVKVSAFVTGKRGSRQVPGLNAAASAEIARWLRLKHIGGTVVIDFLREEGERTAAPELDLRKALADDPAEVTVFPATASGLCELYREPQGAPLSAVYFEAQNAPQPSFDTVTVQLFRTLRDDAAATAGRIFTVHAHPDYISWLNAREHRRTLLPDSVLDRVRWRPDASRPERDPYITVGNGEKITTRETEKAL